MARLDVVTENDLDLCMRDLKRKMEERFDYIEELLDQVETAQEANLSAFMTKHDLEEAVRQFDKEYGSEASNEEIHQKIISLASDLEVARADTDNWFHSIRNTQHNIDNRMREEIRENNRLFVSRAIFSSVIAVVLFFLGQLMYDNTFPSKESHTVPSVGSLKYSNVYCGEYKDKKLCLAKVDGEIVAIYSDNGKVKK